MKLFKKIIVGFVIIITAFILIDTYDNARRKGWFGENKINFETSYLGINIGDKRSDVYHVLGEPTVWGPFSPDNKDSKVDAELLDNTEYYCLEYQKIFMGDVHHRINVKINKNKVVGICSYIEGMKNDSDYKLKWIYPDTSPNEVFKRLGKYSSVIDIKDGVGRIYHFNKNNIYVGVEAGVINFIGIGDLYIDNKLIFYPLSLVPVFR